ncbi:MAG: RNA polymerase sporulation sigma factor SigH [Clostridia bacterium]|nr:RNA polymerase sporulation sigma factor SigH [Clostridia bacterium]
MNSEKLHESQFEALNDEQILSYIKEGNNVALDYLINKYKNFVCAKAKTYFLIGADKEDIIQEGMIGLFKAIRDFKDDKLVSFKSFAEVCVTRQIITAIKTATRQKHMPLNSYVSLNKPMFEDDGDRTLLDTLNHDNISDPEQLFIGKEELYRIEGKINEVLSPFELEVLYAYLQGISYQEIGRVLDKDVKAVDNALQRIKKKIEKFLGDKKFEYM